MFFRKPKLKTDATFVTHIGDILTKELGAHRVFVSTNQNVIRVKSISTHTIHEISFERII